MNEYYEHAEQTKIMLNLKFGSIFNAYDHWASCHYTEEHSLTSLERTIITEYMQDERNTPN